MNGERLADRIHAKTVEELFNEIIRYFPGGKVAMRNDRMCYDAPDQYQRAKGRSCGNPHLCLKTNAKSKCIQFSAYGPDSKGHEEAELNAVGLDFKDLYLEPSRTYKRRRTETVTFFDQKYNDDPKITDYYTRDIDDKDRGPCKYLRYHIYTYDDGTIYGLKVMYRYYENGEAKKFGRWYGNFNGNYQSGLGWIVDNDNQHVPTPLYKAPGLKESSQIVYFAEGEKDVETLYKLGLTPATTLPDGAESKWYDTYNRYVADKTVYFFTDNDDAGRKYGERIAKELLEKANAKNVFLIPADKLLPDCPEKFDITDIYQKIGKDETLQLVAEFIDQAEPFTTFEGNLNTDPDAMRSQKSEQHSKNDEILLDILKSLGAYGLRDLTEQDKKPFEFIVDGMLSVGLSILFGPPKTHKSFLAYQLSFAVANGKSFLGFNTHRNGVVYFDLEGNKCRTANRSERMEASMPDNLLFIHETRATLADTSSTGLTEIIRQIHKQRPEMRLFIIDTFATVRGKAKASGGNAYNDDVQLLKPLHDMAIAENIAVLLVHHTRKGSANFADDFDRVNGTSGLTGTCDNVFDLAPVGLREEGNATLRYTPRDAKNGELKISFCDDSFLWRNMSTAEASADSNPIIKYLTASVLDYARTIPYAEIIAHFAFDNISISIEEIRSAVKEHQLTVFTEKGIVLSAGHRCKYDGADENGAPKRIDGRGVMVLKR